MIKRFIYLFLGLLVGAGVSISFFLFILPSHKTPETVIPLILGSNLEAAKERLSENSLDYLVEYQNGTTKDVVINSFPKEGTRVKAGTKVILYISKMNFEMPDLVNLSEEYAKERIKNINKEITVHVIEEVNNNMPSGYVFKQDPEAFKSLNGLTSVVLYLAKHDDFLVMPSFIGLNINSAYMFSEKNNITFEYDYQTSNYEEGTIINQSVNAGQRIISSKQNVVRITVSKGLKNYMPSFIGLSLDEAINLASIFDIEITIEYVHSNEENNKVINEKNINDKVILYVSI